MRRALILTILCSSLSFVYAQNADTILVNGRVITGDGRDSVTEALAIKDGKVLATGRRADIEKLRVAGTRTVDLKGHTATPGLIDTHIHFQEVENIYAVDLSQARSIPECLDKIKAAVAQVKPGEWIRGGRWDEGKFSDHRYLLASDIDKVAPNNPVWMVQTTGHYGVANSAALKLAHIDETTKNPESGTIDHDANGKPTGVLKEGAAFGMVTRLIPRYSHDQMRAGLLKMIADVNKEGMTGVKAASISPTDWDLYQELRKEDKISVHLFAIWLGGTTTDSVADTLKRINALPHPPGRIDDDVLISGGVKLMLDGSGGARTAWMNEDWSLNYRDTDVGNKGFPNIVPDVYRQQVKMIHDAGIHVSTHAIGDRAIDWVVDTYAQVLKDKATRGLRHGVIHANVPSDHAIETMAMLQKNYDAGYPELQAPFLWWIGDNYAGNYGVTRALRVVPLKTLLTKGVQFAGGSDFSVTPYAARYGLWASVARETQNARYGATPFGTKESVDIHTALKSYTRWAAHQIFLDEKTGSLEAGKDADIAIWDRDFYTVPTKDIKDAKCEMTIFRGKIVWDSKQ
jgi:predicted amidohydrolase YtcJ